jgi:hypothetical protein
LPVLDLAQLVHASVEKNRNVPAMIDAYGEFVDSPLGRQEIQNLEDVFAHILDNLSQRYPDLASKRAASAARTDISSFLEAGGDNADRVKDVLRAELRNVADDFVVSIVERFTKMNSEERKAIDGTLRLIRRSNVEFLFRVERGKHIASSGKDFEKYFASIKSEAPGMKELRYENLIVEKAIFNKLLLKSKDRDYNIWVPSFFAKEKVDLLLDRLSLQSEHLLLARLRELNQQGRLDPLRPFLQTLENNLGELQKPQKQQIPEELSEFFREVGDYVVLPPSELDEAFLFFEEEQRRERAKQRDEEKTRMLQESAVRAEQEKKSVQARERLRQVAIQVPVSGGGRERTESSVYLGKQLDLNQLISAINRRVQEKDIPSQVKETGDYFIELGSIRKNGVTIVGSSGSGRSTTLRRLLDGLASRPACPRIVVIDSKGEHRGIAWKYKWKVFGFVRDSQAMEFRAPLFLPSPDFEETFSALLQEWLMQSGLSCSEEQRARIASVLRSHGKISLGGVEQLWEVFSKESELAQIGQKLKKSFSRNVAARIFSDQGVATSGGEESILYDISGRGLRDPATKEEKQLVSFLMLRSLSNSGTKGALIVLEDLLDRFKSENLRQRTVRIIEDLKANGNSFVATTRSQIREVVGKQAIEFVHRLSGEKTINEEFAEFSTDVPLHNLVRIVGLLPRGHVVSSRITEPTGEVTPSAAVRVELLQFAQG